MKSVEAVLDAVIDAWHASGRQGALEDFPGFVAARRAYSFATYGYDVWADSDDAGSVDADADIDERPLSSDDADDAAAWLRHDLERGR